MSGDDPGDEPVFEHRHDFRNPPGEGSSARKNSGMASRSLVRAQAL
jgi:hypothetical protein